MSERLKTLVFYTGIIFLIFGCKASKGIITGERNLGLSAKEVIKANAKQIPKFKTLQSKVKVVYTQEEKSQSYTVTLRILKDKVIWVNSALSVLRVKITPEKVRFYNKWDNTYFDGDFSYLSNVLGTALDFNKVQNLLLGEALFDLDKSTYDMSVHNNAYLFQPKEQLTLFELFYIINASHFKIDSQQLAQATESRFLEVDYLDYQEIDNQKFPENIKIIVLEGDEETTIQMAFKSVNLNEELRYPFKIPSGFDEIILK